MSVFIDPTANCLVSFHSYFRISMSSTVHRTEGTHSLSAVVYACISAKRAVCWEDCGSFIYFSFSMCVCVFFWEFSIYFYWTTFLSDLIKKILWPHKYLNGSSFPFIASVFIEQLKCSLPSFLISLMLWMLLLEGHSHQLTKISKVTSEFLNIQSILSHQVSSRLDTVDFLSLWNVLSWFLLLHTFFFALSVSSLLSHHFPFSILS
jgi:hypothetical protein